MSFIFAVIKVLVGSFLLFTIARVTQKANWKWVLIVGTLALGNMIIHRLLGSSINPPFFTAVFLGISLSGLSPADTPLSETPWLKRAIIALVIGTAIGWLSFAKIITVQ